MSQLGNTPKEVQDIADAAMAAAAAAAGAGGGESSTAHPAPMMMAPAYRYRKRKAGGGGKGRVGRAKPSKPLFPANDSDTESESSLDALALSAVEMEDIGRVASIDKLANRTAHAARNLVGVVRPATVSSKTTTGVSSSSSRW